MGGSARESLFALTGAPCREFKAKKHYQIFPLLQLRLFINGSLQNKCLLFGINPLTKGAGIVDNHASILEARKVVLGNGSKEKLLKIRNPWVVLYGRETGARNLP